MNSNIKNAIFVASAGTGKTHQVTSLYRSLLLNKPFPAKDSGIDSKKPIYDGKDAVDCGDILMLTFAKNAASEMRSRITEQIEAEIAEKPNDIHLMNILRSLSSANISTIHSFAQRILKENAVEAGIAPSAGLIEEDEMQEMLNASIEGIMLNILEQGGPENENLIGIYRARKADNFIEITRGFISNLQCRSIDLLTLNDAEVMALAPEPVAPGISALSAIADLVEPATSGSKSGKFASAICEEVNRLADTFGEAAEPKDIVTAAGKMHADCIYRKQWGDASDLRVKAGEELDRICEYESYLEARECLISYMLFTKECIQQFEADKKERGVLDYSDLLAKTVTLIEGHPEIVPPFKVIIVDEAQDNSKVQNRLIEGIRAASKASVILCGDSKQTIHTWRGAEYGGMDTMAKKLADIQSIPLFRSFRSQRGILDWINGISSTENMFDAFYSDDHRLTTNDRTEDTHGPNIELLLPSWEYGKDPNETIIVPSDDEELDKKPRLCLKKKDLKKLAEDEIEESHEWQDTLDSYDSRLAQEARALAKRIKLLCSTESDRKWKPEFVFDQEDELWTKAEKPDYHYSDILILLRASTNQPVYEAALREQNIPYSAGGRGKGFFYRQEVRDIISLISWLAFERDGSSLMAVARSPFVTLSDPAIAALSHIDDTTRLDGKVFRKALIAKEELAAVHEDRLRAMGMNDDADAYRRAWTLLKHLRGLTGRVSAVDLIREAIKHSGFDAILAGSFHGAQKLANMRKMLSLLQDLERRNNLDLQALATHLQEYAGKKEAADAIMLDPSDDSVKFSTVHSAKGLTSPVVIMPDLSRTPRADTNWLAVYAKDDESQAISGKFKVIHEGEPEEEIFTSEYNRIKEMQTEQKQEESERLFYVAQTRPRDLLILSGATPERDGAWRSWINDYLLSLEDTERDSQVSLIPYSEISEASDKLAGEHHETIVLDSDIFTRAAKMAPELNLPLRTRMPVTTLVKVPNDDTDGEKVLAYRKSTLVGLAPAWARAKDDDNDDSIDYAARGTIAHSILENLDFTPGENINSQVNKQLSAMSDGSADDNLQLGLITAGEYLQKELNNAEHIIRELPFCTNFGHDGAECLVDGKIDLVYLKDGVWYVVDYKFSSATKSDLLKNYTLQLLVYRSAISREKDSEIRDILLQESESDAKVCMRIMGVATDGTLTVADVDDTAADADVAERVVNASKIYSTSLK